MRQDLNSITHCHTELSILAKSIAYQNLSEASNHVGLSQPQLSRIVAKLEQTLKVTLLDRSAKRKSTWTPLAYKISEAFLKSERKLEHDLHELIEGSHTTSLKIGFLEGFSFLALQLTEHLFHLNELKQIELDVYDLDELEKLFFKNDLDLIFTYREPSKKKYKYEMSLGYQSVDWFEQNKKYYIMSSFELHSKAYKKNEVATDKILVSNSLYIRKSWFEKHGGTGTLPRLSLNQTPKTQDDVKVYLIGDDHLTQNIWEHIKKCSFKLVP